MKKFPGYWRQQLSFTGRYQFYVKFYIWIRIQPPLLSNARFFLPMKEVFPEDYLWLISYSRLIIQFPYGYSHCLAGRIQWIAWLLLRFWQESKVSYLLFWEANINSQGGFSSRQLPPKGWTQGVWFDSSLRFLQYT